MRVAIKGVIVKDDRNDNRPATNVRSAIEGGMFTRLRYSTVPTIVLKVMYCALSSIGYTIRHGDVV